MVSSRILVGYIIEVVEVLPLNMKYLEGESVYQHFYKDGSWYLGQYVHI